LDCSDLATLQGDFAVASQLLIPFSLAILARLSLIQLAVLDAKVIAFKPLHSEHFSQLLSLLLLLLTT
jgi:hypothetical protein